MRGRNRRDVARYHLPVGAEELTAWATIAAVVIAVVAALIALASARSQRIDLLTTIRTQWESLVDDWATAVLIHSGDPKWYYTQASVIERARIAALMAKIRDKTVDLGDRIAALRAETRSVRRVARFLAYAADAVLRGRLSVQDAYAVFGPDVARQRDFVMWVAGRQPIRELHGALPTDEWVVLVDQIYEPTFHDEQDAIVMLADLLSSESAYRGDTLPYRIGERAASARRYFDFGAMRTTLWRLVRLRRTPWMFPRLMKRLRWLTSPPRGVARRPDSDLVAESDVPFFRRGWRTRRFADRTLKEQQQYPRPYEQP